MVIIISAVQIEFHFTKACAIRNICYITSGRRDVTKSELASKKQYVVKTVIASILCGPELAAVTSRLCNSLQRCFIILNRVNVNSL